MQYLLYYLSEMNDLPPPAHPENISTLPDSIDRLLREAHQKVANRHDIASLESDIESLRIEARTIQGEYGAEKAYATLQQRMRRLFELKELGEPFVSTIPRSSPMSNVLHLRDYR